jgi:hypothetical protein
MPPPRAPSPPAARCLVAATYSVDLALARPDRGRAAERFAFVLAYREREVTLAVRDGFVTEEFVDLARTEQPTPEQERRLTTLKARWPGGSWPLPLMPSISPNDLSQPVGPART